MSNDGFGTAMDKRNTALVGALFGLALIGLGLMFLVGQLFGTLFHVNLGHYFWPFYVLVPGAGLLALGLTRRSGSGEPLCIVGSIITMAGLLLFYQNVTGHFASWAYAWALVAPTSVGLGVMAYGYSANLPEKVSAGLNVAKVGAVLFLAGAVFFELIIGISGFGLGRVFWPLLLIGAGALIVLNTLVRRQAAD